MCLSWSELVRLLNQLHRDFDSDIFVIHDAHSGGGNEPGCDKHKHFKGASTSSSYWSFVIINQTQTFSSRSAILLDSLYKLITRGYISLPLRWFHTRLDTQSTIQPKNNTFKSVTKQCIVIQSQIYTIQFSCKYDMIFFYVNYIFGHTNSNKHGQWFIG